MEIKLKADEDICAIRYDNIEKRLEAGSKRFDKIDKLIIGGLIVKIGSKLVDASLLNKIDRLKLIMKEAK